jgi:hypothetical protein
MYPTIDILSIVGYAIDKRRKTCPVDVDLVRAAEAADEKCFF